MISVSTKTKLRDAVHQGHLVYVPTQQFTYQSWTGLVYIDIDPDTGFGGYIIGEGLNGGYTATPVEQWPNGLVNFLIHQGLNNLTATIISPVSGQQFTQGTTVPWQASYNGTVIVIGTPVSWTENLELDSSSWPVGNVVIPSGYGTNNNVSIIIKGDIIPSSLDCTTNLEGRIIPETSGQISEEMHLPLWINTGSGIFRQRLNGRVQFNKQDDIRSHPNAHDFFTELFGDDMTVNNVNNPWIDPTATNTDRYWNMSITFGAFRKAALSEDHERYYMNMRWAYADFPIPEIYEEQKWYFGKKVWIKNPVTRKAVIGGILDYGPSPSEGAGGASPETLGAIGAKHDDVVEFCWATDQNVAYGSIVNY